LEKAHAKQNAADAKALAKREQQATESFARQLEDARAADAQRLEDMAADMALRRVREDEDRAVRLRRMAEDHNDQLAEMARQHSLRLAQIHNHALEERAQLDLEHKEAMVALGVRNDAWIAEIERFERERKRVYDEVWGFPSSGHPSTADPYIGRVLPGVTPIAPYRSTTNNTNSRSITIAPNAINITAPPTMSLDQRTAQWFMGILADFLENFPQ
jgi:hypothetical protein